MAAKNGTLMKILLLVILFVYPLLVNQKVINGDVEVKAWDEAQKLKSALATGDVNQFATRSISWLRNFFCAPICSAVKHEMTPEPVRQAAKIATTVAAGAKAVVTKVADAPRRAAAKAEKMHNQHIAALAEQLEYQGSLSLPFDGDIYLRDNADDTERRRDLPFGEGYAVPVLDEHDPTAIAQDHQGQGSARLRGTSKKPESLQMMPEVEQNPCRSPTAVDDIESAEEHVFETVGDFLNSEDASERSTGASPIQKVEPSSHAHIAGGDADQVVDHGEESSPASAGVWWGPASSVVTGLWGVLTAAGSEVDAADMGALGA